jgi:hypothetical protein
MTKSEAFRDIVSLFKIGAKIVDIDYDPAGSSYSYVPDPKAIAVLEALVGRTVTESDLWFNLGAATNSTYYGIRPELLDEIVGSL